MVGIVTNAVYQGPSAPTDRVNNDTIAENAEVPVAVDVLTEIVIDRPCHEVASYAAHPDNAPDWYVNIKSVEWHTPPTVSVGSRIAFVAQFLGRRLVYTYEIVEFSPGQRSEASPHFKPNALT